MTRSRGNGTGWPARSRCGPSRRSSACTQARIARWRCEVPIALVPSGFFNGRGNSTSRSAGVSGWAARTRSCWAEMMSASRWWTGSRHPVLPTLGMSWTSTGLARRLPSSPAWMSWSRQVKRSEHSSAVRRPVPAPSSTAARIVWPARDSRRARLSGKSSCAITTSGSAWPTASSGRRRRGRSPGRMATSPGSPASTPPGSARPISRQSRRNRETRWTVVWRLGSDSRPERSRWPRRARKASTSRRLSAAGSAP
jgi:hypothetical protein